MPCLMQQQVIDRYNDSLYKNVNIKTKKYLFTTIYKFYTW